jgi:hypothetical protein
MALLEDVGAPRRFERAVWKDVPRCDLEVLETSQRNEIANARRPILRPLPEPDGAELCEGAHGLSEPASSEQDAGDGGRRDGAESGKEDS